MCSKNRLLGKVDSTQPTLCPVSGDCGTGGGGSSWAWLHLLQWPPGLPYFPTSKGAPLPLPEAPWPRELARCFPGGVNSARPGEDVWVVAVTGGE